MIAKIQASNIFICLFILLINISLKSDTQRSKYLFTGKALFAQGNLDDAFTNFCKAIDCLSPQDGVDIEIGNSLLALGNEYFNRGLNNQALTAFDQILRMSDNIAAVHHNIAFTLAERFGKHHEALISYNKALILQPTNVETHFCSALSFLATGNLLRGFVEYEYRWQRKEGAPRAYKTTMANLWDGKQSLKGKTVIICTEQGLGDTLQFIRYAQLLKNDGAWVIAEVQKQLVPLISHCPFIDQVIALGSEFPPYDFYIPTLTLPHVYKTTLETIPQTIPYLFADEQLIVQWGDKLASDTKFKIGICWHGDKVHGESKFMPLKEFIPLLKRTDVSVYSLQQYNGLEQIKLLPEEVHLHCFDETFDRKHGNFIDTAAVMKNFDLIITVDTSIAHLAGGLGVPVWIILPFPAEWRWLLDRVDSPWYPTMTIFRKEAQGSWQAVMQSIMKTLDVLIQLTGKKTI